MALGRTKIARRQRAERAPEPEAEQPDAELDSYLAALAPEESVESTGTGRRFGASEVYQLRLPLMANEQLKELAARQGTSPAALARDWVMQHLSELAHSSPSWPDQERGQAEPQRSAHAAQPYEPEAYGEPTADRLNPGAAGPAAETATEMTIPHRDQFDGGNRYGQGGQRGQADPYARADPYEQYPQYPQGGHPPAGNYPARAQYPQEAQHPQENQFPPEQFPPDAQPPQGGQYPPGGQPPASGQFPQGAPPPPAPPMPPNGQFPAGVQFSQTGQIPPGDQYSPEDDPYGPQHYR